ncbi:MAG TPA: hypothetical protein VFH80_04930 [Solirubrobacteraceae bacterium]|nr:hypothetical protein [Solirubrobacteraceae bacterium]
MSQMSLFSAGAREPQLADLDGLLAGSGQVVRRGREARVSVVVAEGWRVGALSAELAALGLDAELDEVVVDERDADATPGQRRGVAVRTPWCEELRPVADAWTRGAIKIPPMQWALDGPRLRWWCMADGRVGPAMYTLLLGPNDQPAWAPVGAALATAGIPGMLVGPRADGPAYRIVGTRRLNRLRELVGDPPAGASPTEWPAADYARGA